MAVCGVIAAAVARPSLPLVRCGVRREAESAEFKTEVGGNKRGGMPGFGLRGAAGKKKRTKKEKVEVVWQCARGCGACCKLDKGPAFPAPEDIFADDPFHLQVCSSYLCCCGTLLAQSFLFSFFVAALQKPDRPRRLVRPLPSFDPDLFHLPRSVCVSLSLLLLLLLDHKIFLLVLCRPALLLPG